MLSEEPSTHRLKDKSVMTPPLLVKSKLFSLPVDTHKGKTISYVGLLDDANVLSLLFEDSACFCSERRLAAPAPLLDFIWPFSSGIA